MGCLVWFRNWVDFWWLLFGYVERVIGCLNFLGKWSRIGCENWVHFEDVLGVLMLLAKWLISIEIKEEEKNLLIYVGFL